jgi:hypothetical protein
MLFPSQALMLAQFQVQVWYSLNFRDSGVWDKLLRVSGGSKALRGAREDGIKFVFGEFIFSSVRLLGSGVRWIVNIMERE